MSRGFSNLQFTRENLDEVLGNHVALAADVAGSDKVLPHFCAYIERSYYPFYKEAYGGYGQRAAATIGLKDLKLKNDSAVPAYSRGRSLWRRMRASLS